MLSTLTTKSARQSFFLKRRDRVTRFGHSLVYPGLGVVRRAPPQSRGLAMGAYTVFLDVALGFGSPALPLIAAWAGLGAVFLANALMVISAAAIAMRLLIAAPVAQEAGEPA
jgi:hypothetical protein